MIHLTALTSTVAAAVAAQTNTTITKPLFPDPPSSTELMLRGLLSAGLYGKTGTDEDVRREEAFRHGQGSDPQTRHYVAAQGPVVVPASGAGVDESQAPEELSE